MTPQLSSALLPWLSLGGDSRIVSSPQSGLNAYGCSAAPDQLALAYGSSTASSISAPALAEISAAWLVLAPQALGPAAPVAYARETEGVRSALGHMLGLNSLPGTGIILAASGTDLHLIAAQLAGSGKGPLKIVMTEAAETGTGVPAALSGRHVSDRAAMAGAVRQGETLAGCREVQIAEVLSRDAAGAPRPEASVDQEAAEIAAQAAKAGQELLLIVSDISKTGLLAPSPACALSLLQRYPETLRVLVDACQFRLSPASLRAYLESGFMVAITGSKFATGPAFSGALLLPASLASRLKKTALPASLAAYSARADWPEGWSVREQLPDAANFGLLLRWKAALAEIRAFQALPDDSICRFLKTFAESVREKLQHDQAFEALAAPEPKRGLTGNGSGWDSVQTLFPFILRATDYLSVEKTAEIYKTLVSHHCHLGQPSPCGIRSGKPVSALRLSASMRLVTDALAPQGRGAEAVISGALSALDQAAALSS